MKRYLRSGLLVLAALAIPGVQGSAQQENAPLKDIPKNLHPYFVALLVKGDRYTAEQTPELINLMRQHLAYIRSQTEKKAYVFAGPFSDEGMVAGMIVLRTGTRNEAEAILNQDPAVRAGQFKVELHSAMFPQIDSTAVY